MEKHIFVKRASVLLLTFLLVFSTIIVTADTSNDQMAVSLSDHSVDSQQNNGHDIIPPLDVLWDNGDTDGSNGLSHAPQSAFGFERALLDDFVIPEGDTWTITDFHSYNLWNSLTPPQGTDFVLEFWSDAGGSPGAMIASTVTVSYTETPTGRTWFSRPEFEITYEFEPVVLGEGTYWIWGHVDGPENCFWMARLTITGSEAWIDYEDYPPLQPTSTFFGTAYDLSFVLTGSSGPEPLEVDINGPYEGMVGEDIEFTSTVTGGTPPYTYAWDFGDESGTSDEANPTYAYDEAGEYDVTLTVTDAAMATADDATTATISAPPVDLEITIAGGLGVTATVENVGDDDAEDLDYELTVTGGILGRIDKTVNGTIEDLASGETYDIPSGILFGLGAIEIAVTVGEADASAEGTQIIIFTIVKAE